jgi:hypothetical protein
MMLAIGLSYIALIRLRYITSIPSFIRAFIMKGVEFYHRLFLHLLRWSSDQVVFVFASVSMLHYI